MIMLFCFLAAACYYTARYEEMCRRGHYWWNFVIIPSVGVYWRVYLTALSRRTWGKTQYMSATTLFIWLMGGHFLPFCFASSKNSSRQLLISPFFFWTQKEYQADLASVYDFWGITIWHFPPALGKRRWRKNMSSNQTAQYTHEWVILKWLVYENSWYNTNSMHCA